MPTDSHITQDLYDIELLRIDAHSGTLYFAGGHLLTLARREELRWWHVGEIGVLRLGTMPQGWGWRPYPDQRLRRAPDRDDPPSGRWAWRLVRADAGCADDYLLTKVGVIPGANGAFVPQDAETVAIDLPREFRELCRAYRQQPTAVLCAFIADVCALQNFVKCPREDGYCSLGSDERQRAQEYFVRAYGMYFEDEAS
ncbi:MAG: hypothetical protein SXG53_18820 [Pseudomonadota bacterium]|nr:hypothetical protein [Pseudomonadota bacterium]